MLDSPICRLPEDCLCRVLGLLSAPDLLSCRRVSLRFSRVSGRALGAFCRYVFCLVKGGCSVHFLFSRQEILISDAALLERGRTGIAKLSLLLRQFGADVRSFSVSTVGCHGTNNDALMHEVVNNCANLCWVELKCDFATMLHVRALRNVLSCQRSTPILRLELKPPAGAALLHMWQDHFTVSEITLTGDFSENDWQTLLKFPAIRKLHLVKFPLDLSDLTLWNCPKLKALMLSQTVGFFDLEMIQTVTNLSLIQCSDITVSHIGHTLPSLEHLDIRDCSLLTAEELMKVVHLLTNLEYFRFRGGGWDFRWNIADLVKSVLRFSSRRIRGLNVAAISNNHPEDLQLILNILSAHVEAPSFDDSLLYFDFGLSASGGALLKLGHSIVTNLGKNFGVQMKFRVEKFLNMEQCSRITFQSVVPGRFRPYVILSDLPSVREAFWHRNLLIRS